MLGGTHNQRVRDGPSNSGAATAIRSEQPVFADAVVSALLSLPLIPDPPPCMSDKSALSHMTEYDEFTDGTAFSIP